MKKITAVKPTGTRLLVELLTRAELYGTELYVGNNETKSDKAPQGYVVEIGYGLTDHDYLKVGARVLLSGNVVPAPKCTDSNAFGGKEERKQVLIEFTDVRAILVEE